jgi:uncharacterized protein YndB with AHSA1/START domain
MAERSRGYALRIDINAEPARVWRALTEGALLARWCSANARISARAGGSFTASLDRQHELIAHIDVFDPPRRLRLIHLPSAAVPESESATVDDLMIEWRPPETVLRVLGSGFSEAQAHARQLRDHQAGWRLSLARLKIYLEKGLDSEGASP